MTDKISIFYLTMIESLYFNIKANSGESLEYFEIVKLGGFAISCLFTTEILI